MSLREKIVVAMAVLAVLYGAYELGLKNLFSGNDTTREGIAREKQSADDTDAAVLTAKIIKKVESVALTPRETHILENSDSAWDRDPFIDATTAMSIRAAEASESAIDAETEAEQKKFTYSGFIALGNVRLAVINGMEYEAGETLKETEYVVQTIRPSRVVLFDGRRHITVHLEETEAKVE